MPLLILAIIDYFSFFDIDTPFSLFCFHRYFIPLMPPLNID